MNLATSSSAYCPVEQRNLLVILVANVPDDVRREDAAFARTRELLDLAGGLDRARNVDVAIVDRVNTPVPRRAGVGLARKIGADIALRLIVERRIEVPVIFSTDARCRVAPRLLRGGRGTGCRLGVSVCPHERR